MKFTKGQSGNPAGRPKKSPPKPQPPGILSKILITHPDDPPNRKYEMFGRPSIDIMANLLWSAVTNGEARFVHGVLPLSFAEWFELVKWLFDEIDQPPPTADSPALPTSRLREKLIELADDPSIGQSHFDNKNALANMIWCAVYDGLMGTRTGFVHLTAHEWFTLIRWVGDHTKLLPEPPTPPEPRSNNPPDPSPDKTGNYRDTEVEELNTPIFPPPPPPDSPAQTNSNETPDPAPDKTGNYREIESEQLNAPVLPPPDSPAQTNSNETPDPSPDKTGNYREIESEQLNAPVLPPPDSPAQTNSNETPDPAPDKTGNYREIESEQLNAPVLPPPDSPAQTNSNETPDPSPDKTGNYREIESEQLNAPVLPPPDSPAQTNSNETPDPAPDKTGNYREIESEQLNAPVLPPPDSPAQTNSNETPDPSPDKTGNYRDTEFEEYNFEYTERPIPAGAYRRATAGRPIIDPDAIDDPD